MKIRNGLLALSLFVLALAGFAGGQTRTLSLVNGDSLTPASGYVDLSGVTTYYGGFINGQVMGNPRSTFTFSIAFREVGVIDAEAGIYSGTVLAPSSSFAITETSSAVRKASSTTTSGTIDSGDVVYRRTDDNRAEIISVFSSSLTIWEGKNKSRRAVGNGMLDYGTSAEGSGYITLNRF